DQIGIDVPQVNGANVGSSQIVIVDGVQDLESDTKQVNARLNFDPEIGTAAGSHPYAVYWGNRVAMSHTVTVTNADNQSTTSEETSTHNSSNEETSRTVTLTWNHGYTTTVAVSLDSTELATISGSLTVAVKAAGTGDDFTSASSDTSSPYTFNLTP